MDDREVSVQRCLRPSPMQRKRLQCTTSRYSPGESLTIRLSFFSRNLGGRKVRVHLERDSHHDLHPRRPSDQFSAGVRASPPAPANGFWQTPYPQHNGGPPHLSMAAYPQETQTGDSPSPSAARLPWALNTSLNGIQTTPARGPLGNGGGEGSPHISFRQMHHPGPISMPPFPSMENGNPLSPLQTRGFPPMTPSMPGFVFNAYPETPPIHAHFLSPGLGPFSPGIPITSPTAYSYNSFLNLAPGGPVNRFPQGGSAQLDTPTTQSFPSNLIHGYAGAPGPANISQALAGVGNDYFPSQPLGPAPNPPSPSPRVPNRPKATASPLNAGDHLVETPWGEGHSDLSLLTASMSLNGARDVNRPAPTSLGQSQRSASGLNLADLVKGEAHANRASLDGPRPTLDAGWTGERRASFGDIGSREAK